jgi:NAD(P)-dependent dehydrogenase (short-subunit alcohol dehydrogenase family)
MKRFTGRAVFITGGAHGIGRATAKRLVQEGALVTIADIDDYAAHEVTRELNADRRVAFMVHCDITDAESVDAAIAASVKQFGAMDVLVHTAGGDRAEPSFDQTDDGLWQGVVDFNLVGTVRCIRAAIPHLLQSKAGGSVVAVGSVNGLTALGSFPYSSAKAGLPILIQNLAVQYGGSGMRFNLVVPATVHTRVWENQADSLRRLTKLYPLGRIGEPEDIAAAIAFLSSEDAAWITGVTLPVDGGMLAGPRH